MSSLISYEEQFRHLAALEYGLYRIKRNLEAKGRQVSLTVGEVDVEKRTYALSLDGELQGAVSRVKINENPKNSGKYVCEFKITEGRDELQSISEGLKAICDILKMMGLKRLVIKVSHCGIVKGILKLGKVPDEQFKDVCSSIDKLPQLQSSMRKEVAEFRKCAKALNDRLSKPLFVEFYPKYWINVNVVSPSIEKHSWAEVQKELMNVRKVYESVDKMIEFFQKNGTEISFLNELLESELGNIAEMHSVLEYLKKFDAECADLRSDDLVLKYDLSLVRDPNLNEGIIFEVQLVSHDGHCLSLMTNEPCDRPTGSKTNDHRVQSVSLQIENLLSIADSNSDAIVASRISIAENEKSLIELKEKHFIELRETVEGSTEEQRLNDKTKAEFFRIEAELKLTKDRLASLLAKRDKKFSNSQT